MTLGSEARSFRAAFGQESLPGITSAGFIKQQLWDLQLDLIEEEVGEFFDAADRVFHDPTNQDLRVALVKEMSDAVFVFYQFAAAFNIDLDEAMTRVYESNMSKLDDNGKPIYRTDGKVLKGPNYQAPDLSVCVSK
tara:strand:+ start:236 stop:643 length:408 start_codon:yes stop_codon:yes gene_type:complete